MSEDCCLNVPLQCVSENVEYGHVNTGQREQNLVIFPQPMAVVHQEASGFLIVIGERLILHLHVMLMIYVMVLVEPLISHVTTAWQMQWKLHA